MSRDALAIWWTTQDECQAISQHFAQSSDLPLPQIVPTYVQSEYSLRVGRVGRGRLWIADELGDVPRFEWPCSPLATHCERCGGIVIRRCDVPTLRHLPGIVTNFGLERIHG